MELSALIEKYNRCEITRTEIQTMLDVSWKKLNKMMKKQGLKTRQELWDELNFDGSLRELLIWKYRSFVRRCKGKGSSSKKYIGKEYMSIEEWVAFCNSQQKRISKLWEQYKQSGKQLKYAISIDRLDNNKGYISSNLQFVTHGFNSWKDHTTPISVEHEGTGSCLVYDATSKYTGTVSGTTVTTTAPDSTYYVIYELAEEEYIQVTIDRSNWTFGSNNQLISSVPLAYDINGTYYYAKTDNYVYNRVNILEI